jgi:hypothetical protein
MTGFFQARALELHEVGYPVVSIPGDRKGPVLPGWTAFANGQTEEQLEVLIRREIKEGRLPAFHVGRLLRVAGEDAIKWRDRYRDAACLEDPQSSDRMLAVRARPLAEAPGS